MYSVIPKPMNSQNSPKRMHPLLHTILRTGFVPQQTSKTIVWRADAAVTCQHYSWRGTKGYLVQKYCKSTLYVQDWSLLRNLRKLRKFVIFVKFAFLFEPLSIQATVKKERGIFMLYLPTEICWRAQRELRIFWKIYENCEISQFL